MLHSFSNLRSDFHGGNTGSNPVGDAKSSQELTGKGHFYRRHKKAQLHRQLSDQVFAIASVFRHRELFLWAQKGTRNSARSGSPNRRCAKEANDLTLSSSFVNCHRLSVRIQCHSAGSMTKQFLHYLDVCFSLVARSSDE